MSGACPVHGAGPQPGPGVAVGSISVFICPSAATSGKKQAAKSKEELAQEKKKELEKRLQDVSGQLNSKKPTKKGTHPGPAVVMPPAASVLAAFWRAAVRRGPGTGQVHV